MKPELPENIAKIAADDVREATQRLNAALRAAADYGMHVDLRVNTTQVAVAGPMDLVSKQHVEVKILRPV